MRIAVQQSVIKVMGRRIAVPRLAMMSDECMSSEGEVFDCADE